MELVVLIKCKNLIETINDEKIKENCSDMIKKLQTFVELFNKMIEQSTPIECLETIFLKIASIVDEFSAMLKLEYILGVAEKSNILIGFEAIRMIERSLAAYMDEGILPLDNFPMLLREENSLFLAEQKRLEREVRVTTRPLIKELKETVLAANCLFAPRELIADEPFATRSSIKESKDTVLADNSLFSQNETLVDESSCVVKNRIVRRHGYIYG